MQGPLCLAYNPEYTGNRAITATVKKFGRAVVVDPSIFGNGVAQLNVKFGGVLKGNATVRLSVWTGGTIVADGAAPDGVLRYTSPSILSPKTPFAVDAGWITLAGLTLFTFGYVNDGPAEVAIDNFYLHFIPPEPVAAVRIPRAPEPPTPVDIDCITDFSPTLDLADGLKNMANALARRLMTPRGGLFYDPDYGLDLREYLNAGLNDAELMTLAGAVGLELEKDERVASCAVGLRYSYSSLALLVDAKVTLVTGQPLRLMLSVKTDGVTVEDLRVAA